MDSHNSECAEAPQHAAAHPPCTPPHASAGPSAPSAPRPGSCPPPYSHSPWACRRSTHAPPRWRLLAGRPRPPLPCLPPPSARAPRPAAPPPRRSQRQGRTHQSHTAAAAASVACRPPRGRAPQPIPPPPAPPPPALLPRRRAVPRPLQQRPMPPGPTAAPSCWCSRLRMCAARGGVGGGVGGANDPWVGLVLLVPQQASTSACRGRQAPGDVPLRLPVPPRLLLAIFGPCTPINQRLGSSSVEGRAPLAGTLLGRVGQENGKRTVTVCTSGTGGRPTTLTTPCKVDDICRGPQKAVFDLVGQLAPPCTLCSQAQGHESLACNPHQRPMLAYNYQKIQPSSKNSPLEMTNCPGVCPSRSPAEERALGRSNAAACWLSCAGCVT